MDWEKANLYAQGLSRMAKMGFDPFGPYVHACHETRWFERVIGKYNFWGCKPPKWWTKKIIEVPTHEYRKDRNGQWILDKVTGKPKKFAEVCKFVDFDDINHAFKFYERLIWRLYPLAGKKRHLAQGFFKGLVEGKFKWATDPVYEKSLNILCNEITHDEDHISILGDRITDYRRSLGADV